MSIRGAMEVGTNHESFEACWNGSKHHIVLFLDNDDIRWLKPGTTVCILERLDEREPVSHRHITVKATHMEKMNDGVHILSFHHVHKDGQTCCLAERERRAS